MQKNEFLRPVLSGEKIVALAPTEPQAGSDAGSIKTRARRNGSRDARFMMIGGGTSEIVRFMIQREGYREMGGPS